MFNLKYSKHCLWNLCNIYIRNFKTFTLGSSTNLVKNMKVFLNKYIFIWNIRLYSNEENFTHIWHSTIYIINIWVI
jgi:hypothetical protein